MGRRGRGVRGGPPGGRGDLRVPHVLRVRDGAVHGGRGVVGGPAHRLVVRAAPVHGPRRPRALLRPAAVRGARDRALRGRRLRLQELHQDRAADRGAGAAGRPPGAPRARRGRRDPDHPRRRRELHLRSAFDANGLLLAARRASCSTPAPTPRTRRSSGARRPTAWAARTGSRRSTSSARSSTRTPRRRPRSAASGRPR